MEREKKTLSPEGIVKILETDAWIGIPLSNPHDLAMIQDAAYPVIGPLRVGIDTKLEMYVICRDRTDDTKKFPGRFG